METNFTPPVRRKRNGWHIFGAVVLSVFSLLAFVAFFSARWYVSVYGRIGFDSILYTLTNDLGGTQSTLIVKYLTGALLPAIVCSTAVCLLLFFPWKRKLSIPLPRKHHLRLLPVNRVLASVLSFVLSLALLTHAAFNSELVDYVISRMQISSLYENEYMDPADVEIVFPEEKRNLIYIYLESMESSYLSKEQGGAMDTCLIPELYDLANSNINFSHNDGVGGLVEVPGASWTIGAMVAQTAGVPLVTPSDVTDWQNGYGTNGEFLPGLTTLSDILAENGYYQALMVGSDADFGGRATYFSTHGVDQIYDLYTARADHIVPWNYYVWWGIEDMHLFEYAQQELLELAQQEQPFAFTMLTVDTHHIGGYTCQLCGDDYEESYENAIACSSRQVAEFVSWIQAQDFYENTTVIITGDHFSMDSGYFTRAVGSGYARHGYNCFLNAAVEPLNTDNREFSALDMFPTTLAAMGCTIEGDRLGLGTNLFSARQTLIEKYGISALSAELSKRSDYYEERFYTAQQEE